MFESDDFDSVLSQLDYSDVLANSPFKNDCDNLALGSSTCNKNNSRVNVNIATTSTGQNETTKNTNFHDWDGIEKNKKQDEISRQSSYESHLMTNLNKRKQFGCFFDRQSKRRFPGPAGLLTGSLDVRHDDNISRMEILSQDVECSQGQFQSNVFESRLWSTLQCDIRDWGLDGIDYISSIKQAALAGRLTRRKAHIITAFIEAIDRSAIDPLIILRDSTGAINCTLHRDAWSAFSPYIISEYTALALWKPTVLTTKSKKHYLNITISNIIAIYSSKCVNNSQEEGKQLPNGYSIKCLEDFTIVKMDSCPRADNDEPHISSYLQNDSENMDARENHLEGLDDLSFLDEVF